MHFETKTEIEEYLRQYEALRYKLEIVLSELYGIRAVNADKEPANGGSLADTFGKYNDLITRETEIEKQMLEIKNFIMVSFYGKGQLIIWYKYIKSMSFSTIGYEMKPTMSRASVYRIYNATIIAYIKKIRHIETQ